MTFYHHDHTVPMLPLSAIPTLDKHRDIYSPLTVHSTYLCPAVDDIYFVQRDHVDHLLALLELALGALDEAGLGAWGQIQSRWGQGPSNDQGLAVFKNVKSILTNTHMGDVSPQSWFNLYPWCHDFSCGTYP